LANIGNAALTKLFGSTTLDTLASSVLSMVAPVSLGVLGRETGGTVGALSQFLSSQKDKLSLSAPYHRPMVRLVVCTPRHRVPLHSLQDGLGCRKRRWRHCAKVFEANAAHLEQIGTVHD